jgi:protein-tyrosine phosphatase
MKILFVCTGNICRSPTAEAVFRTVAAEAGLGGRLEIDSAGTHGYHVGEPPDGRTRQAAALRGYDMTTQRARKVQPSDFEDFDLILAMDRGHLDTLQAAATCPIPIMADRKGSSLCWIWRRPAAVGCCAM